MNLRQLTHFRYAYETKSYTRAAFMVPMSPQGLSRSVHKLERELGYPLFTARQGVDEIAPTAYADALYGFALAIGAQSESLKHELQRIHFEESETIRLTAVQGSYIALGRDFIERYERAHPSVTIIAQEAGDFFCDEALANGECDLALTRGPYSDAFETTEVFKCRISYWVRSGSDLARKDSIRLVDLHGRRLCLLDKSLKIYGEIMGACEKAGAHPKSVATSLEEYYIYDWVLRGGEVGLTTDVLAAAPVFNQSEEVVAVPAENLFTTIGISRPKAKPLPRHVQQFYEYCLDTLGKHDQTIRRT